MKSAPLILLGLCSFSSLIEAAPKGELLAKPPAPPSDEVFQKGPYLQYPRKSAMSLLWETFQPKNFLLQVFPVGQSKAVFTWRSTEAKTMNKVTITGLRPGTGYRYQLVKASPAETGSERTGRFQTAPSAEEPFTFLVYGDSRSGHSTHQTVVDAMHLERPAFTINTGDLVEDGAQASQWQDFFRIERKIMGEIPLFPVLGNHELTSNWTQGERHFRRYFDVPQNGPEPGITYSFRYGNSLFLVLNSCASFVGTAQTAWAISILQKALSKDIAHVFVFVHHGPYASAIHGPNQDLHDSGLVQAFEQYGVDIIFSGHDHTYEHGQVRGLRYVVTAGAGAPLYPRRRETPHTQMMESSHHYVRLHVRGRDVEMTALRPDGSRIDFVHYRKWHQGPGRAPRFQTISNGPTAPFPARNSASRREKPKTQTTRLRLPIIAVIFSLISLGILSIVLAKRLRRFKRASS